MTGIATPAESGPLVSVIVPAYNAEATLADTLRSVLASSYRKIEVIVVDDGSMDASAEVAQDFARTDPRVRVHRRANGGVSAAFNSGLALARGEFVARLDSDDLWHRAKVERQVRLAKQNPDAALIYTFVRYIDGEGRVLCDADQQRFPRHALCRGIYDSLIGGNSSAMMRRSLVEEFGGYDETLTSWEDLLLQLRISASHAIVFVPEYLVGYRVRPSSLSADPQNMLSSWRLARQRIRKLFPRVPRTVRNWAQGIRYTHFAESFARHRRFDRALTLLIEASWHDPIWTFWFVYDRISRQLRRPSVAVHKARPVFLDCAPDHRLPAGTELVTAAGIHLRRIYERRTAQLAALDEQLAAGR